MGGYDLYGNYYERTVDAENAELSQMAEIDRNNQRLEAERNYRKQYEQDMNIQRLIEENEQLKLRVSELEKLLLKQKPKILRNWALQ